MLKIGYKASAEQFGPNELLDFSCTAEEVGFDSVFISDHFQPWKHTDGHAPSSFAWLGALGARTKRIVIGTSVMTPTFRYHPSIVAQAFATLGVMFPGRVVLGLGSGESLNDVPALGIKWPGFKERTARLRESIELIRALWTQERVSFEGQYYKTEKATIYDRPETPVPIYVAASGPTVAKMAGEIAEGYICTSGKAPELYTETLLPNVAAGLQAAGRASDSIDRMIEMKVSFDTDRQRALDDTRNWAALALSPEEKVVGRGSGRDGEARRCAAGRAHRQALDRLDRPGRARRADQGLCRSRLSPSRVPCPGPDQKRFLHLYGEQVLPRLRAAFG